MFFIIAKTLGVMVEAPQIFMELLVVGVILLWTRWNRAGRILTTLMAVVVLVVSITPISIFLARPLEDRFPQPDLAVAPTGVIVLGGAMDEGVTRARNMPTLNDAAERLTEPVGLLQRFPNVRLVFSGGSAKLSPDDWTEADVARMLWRQLGVPDDRMSFEDKSRDTWQNAVFTKELVQPKPGERWLLVTSAMHMPRSVGIFRKIGFDVIPYPVDYQTGSVRGDFAGFRKPADAVRILQSASHEWIGLVSYYLTGKMPELFPATVNCLPRTFKGGRNEVGTSKSRSVPTALLQTRRNACPLDPVQGRRQCQSAFSEKRAERLSICSSNLRRLRRLLAL